MIVDVNIAHAVRDGDRGAGFDFRDLSRGLMLSRGPCKKAVLSYGGKVQDELLRDEETRRWIVRLDERGKATQAPYDAVATETEHVEALRICRSDDPHVIALARIHGARVLCSNDAELMDDFRDRSILDPPGRIYRTASRSHNDLIRARC